MAGLIPSWAIWSVIALAIVGANLPFLNHRIFLIGPLKAPKPALWHVVELVTYATLVAVAGRMLEFGFLRRLHPLLSARAAALAHPLGVACWLLLGPVAGPAFALLHGAGNGILTIAKGTLPLVFFGPVGYGQRQGIMMAPSRVAQAFAPLLFGLCIERWGSGALWISGGLGLSALAVLGWLKAGPAR